MNAYAFRGDLYCERCVRSMADRVCIAGETADPGRCPCWNHVCDSHCCAQGPIPRGGGEADVPQHCGNCDAFLENPLTTAGYLWVQGAIADHFHEQGGAIGEWVRFYDYFDILRRVGA